MPQRNRFYPAQILTMIIPALTGFLAIFASTIQARAADRKIQNSDLAIILPAQKNLRIAALDVASPGKQTFLSEDLLQLVEKSYEETSVGDAMARENSHSDWTLVSLRVVPCSPLGVIPGPETNLLCWPEIRLVWQPILKDFRRYAVILNWFADDRAIHALYDAPTSLGLTTQQAQRAESLLSKVRMALAKSPVKPLSLLSESDVNEFVKLRDSVSDALMEKALSLRAANLTDSAYAKTLERPEFNNSNEAPLFINRLKAFVASTTSTSGLKEMTSFSLPEGREPPQADEWVFLKYLKQNGRMNQVEIQVISALDGRVLINLGKSPKASQLRDDPQLHTALETMNAADAEEIKKRVLLSAQDLGSKKIAITDRAVSLVPNTTCASCHKFNSLRFDFHSLSYLEDRTISISPRVETDILRDLQWLQLRSQRQE